MDVAPDLITRDFTFELIGADGLATIVGVRMMYDLQDPYAATAEFQTPRGAVRWVFARQLLADGMYGPAGAGDVQVWPSLDARGRSVLVIELSSPEGSALLQANTREVAKFIRSSELAIPMGAEGDFVDVDAALEQLLPH
jgi:hypothetical protein